MADLLCPECGCAIGEDAYEADDVMYCCEPCAADGQCECGCCDGDEED